MFLVDETADRADILIGVDDLISGYRVGDALDRDIPTLLAVDAFPAGMTLINLQLRPRSD